MEELTLDGLAPEDVAALLAQSNRERPADRLAARVRARTAGNPFFIEELIRHMEDTAGGALATTPIELPASIRQAVATASARLGSPTVALLTAGAVLGPEFDLELAAEVEGLPLDAALHALDDAVRGGLIVEVSGPAGARHVHARARARRTRRLADGCSPGAAARARRGGARTARAARSRAAPRGSGPPRARGSLAGG